MCPVAWEEVCKPKHEGGLGIRSLMHWNMAAVGKHIWAIAQKKDNLWVRWVHTIYIKNRNWVEYSPTQICSWVWKGFCRIKDQLVSAGVDIMSSNYSIKKVYETLRPKGEKTHWGKAIWCTAAVPKHQFLTWLAFKQRLLTRDRLKKMALIEDQWCCLCDTGVETHSHLFFECPFSKACYDQVTNWLGLNLRSRSLQHVVGWIARSSKGSKLKRQVYSAALNAMVYLIWAARNDQMWNKHKRNVERIIKEVRYIIKNRIPFVNNNFDRNIDDSSWFHSL